MQKSHNMGGLYKHVKVKFGTEIISSYSERVQCYSPSRAIAGVYLGLCCRLLLWASLKSCSGTRLKLPGAPRIATTFDLLALSLFLCIKMHICVCTAKRFVAINCIFFSMNWF